MGQIIPALLFQPPPPSYGKDKKLLWLKTARKDVVFRELQPVDLFKHESLVEAGTPIRNFFIVDEIRPYLLSRISRI